MDSMLFQAAALLFSIVLAVQGSNPRDSQYAANFPPLPTKAPGAAVAPTRSYFYNEKPPPGAVQAITDSPIIGKYVPKDITSKVHGSECTVYSEAFPDQYLTMASGYVHFYPELKRGNPKAVAGQWDWSGVWKITWLPYQGKNYFQLWNHETHTFLTYNETKYNFVRGTTKDKYVANLWDLVSHTKPHAASYYTIQHSQPPNGFLHALTSRAKSETRPVGILPQQQPINKDIYQWKISCGT
ncbi:uncharacterized protein LOC135942739 [Cloeon dipterum]|uniref:uncharacterized protein LOC135942739 n=1 Tax=Cloeon dipterum TaxID=197152 RepID=UPI00321FE4B9